MFKKIILASALLLVCFASQTASASERFSFGFGVSESMYGRYETRLVTVLAEPARHEYIVIRAEYIEKVVVNGVETDIRHPAQYEDRVIPARYETRYETVWVPGYVVEPSVGFRFGFHDSFYHRR